MTVSTALSVDASISWECFVNRSSSSWSDELRDFAWADIVSLAGIHGCKETNGSAWYESKSKRAAILSDYDDLWTSLSDVN